MSIVSQPRFHGYLRDSQQAVRRHNYHKLYLLFGHQVMSDSATPWTKAWASLSLTVPQSSLKLMPAESATPPNPLILCHPFFSCPQSFPASGSFPKSQLFTSGGQNTGASASASVLPIDIQGWFPPGWTGMISLLAKGLSRVFSSTTIQKPQFFNLLHGPTLTSIHYDRGKP